MDKTIILNVQWYVTKGAIFFIFQNFEAVNQLRATLQYNTVGLSDFWENFGQMSWCANSNSNSKISFRKNYFEKLFQKRFWSLRQVGMSSLIFKKAKN